MFNLLVAYANDSDPWDNGSYSFTKDRIAEYTAKHLAELYTAQDHVRLKELTSYPCVFVSEQESHPSRIGRITSVDVRSRDVAFTFELSPEFPPLPPGTIEQLSSQLDIDSFELHRTHWAIKEGQLPDIVRSWMASKTGISSGVTIDHVAPRATLSTEEEAKQNRPACVVVADERFASMLSQALAQLPINLIIRGGRNEVITELNTVSPSLVIADFDVDVTGDDLVSLLQIAHAGHPSCYRILVSAAGDFDKAVAFATELGADTVLPRVSSSENIQKVLSKGLQIHRRRLASENKVASTQSDAKTEDPHATALPASKPARIFKAQGTPSYTGEFCGIGTDRDLVDNLGVEPHALRLADLIALRQTKLPLAIGLFGNWGSGKSHFMNLIDRRIKQRMSEEARNGREVWCAQVVPIYFNAWHYLDTDIWASIVTQVFDALFTHLRGNPSQLEVIERLLAAAQGTTTRSSEELALAEKSRASATRTLSAAQSAVQEQENLCNGLIWSLKHLLPGVAKAELSAQAKAALGHEADVQTIQKLEQVVLDARSFAKQATLLRSACMSLGLGWRVGYLLGAILVAAIITFHIRELEGAVQQGVSMLLSASGIGLGALVFATRKTMLAARTGLAKISEWQLSAEKARLEAARTPEVVAAQERLRTAEAAETEARVRLDEARTREAQLKQQAHDLLPERRLGRFIEERSQSKDYRGRLGLIGLVRRDFQELSNIFTDSAGSTEHIKKLLGNSVGESDIAKLGRSIDRIVLYIDDLDRCGADKVVDVLQAVHLLLAFPLFAVVVGVDQRCLHLSLKNQMNGLVGIADPPNGKNNISPEAIATPLDYLEKIFHIPFHLPSMSATGFAQLMHHLAGSKTPSSNERTPQTPGDANELGRSALNVTPQHANTPTSEHASESTGQPSVSSDLVKSAVGPDVDTGSAPIEQWEVEALKDYHQLVRTPRSAKRLLNIYRIVRSGIPQEEWLTFSGTDGVPGEYRMAMILVVLAAGNPSAARPWFRYIATTHEQLGPGTSFTPAEWIALKSIYRDTSNHDLEDFDRSRLLTWILRVEPFTF